jgi:hypothetical protein
MAKESKTETVFKYVMYFLVACIIVGAALAIFGIIKY